MYLKADALITYFLGIPFPERLDDDLWSMKLAQLTWLSEQGFLNINSKSNE